MIYITVLGIIDMPKHDIGLTALGVISEMVEKPIAM